MEIIPAIDLRGGAVVRLLQGNYDRQTTFGDDPVGVARGFEADGAPRIHVVDLDGAREGRRTQAAEVRAVAAAVGIPIELGGGLRSADVIAEVIADGVDRVVLGTAAVEEPELIEQALAAHGAERVIVGIDAREGIASVSGWTESGAIPAPDLLNRMVDVGVRRFIYTDITRDGTLTSPNFSAVSDMVERADAAGGARIIASGGIAEIDHLRTLASIGAEGAIIGAAIYLGTLDLAAAVAELG
ncbi:MAG: 1-(5-phosphoribosyl)-5-[(5-phosphoribosylamino)methylideneamino]imidazole-4-carboxamide isomerase [Chloroflexota bacterium]|nr:1-(5-phosphoribosyl)-5-[(5-phosphoribosylamino)methylideneamino]imidazole-4-carboxamide isomerase [Chloroflexota bacterium]MDE2883973.1 1-(5-phosphoribosyl)-5-[(5-phosphoribosylamino)methylideneamino]imidazole-4-carboxamide isomerase [Chloroflexota bacterium]